MMQFTLLEMVAYYERMLKWHRFIERIKNA